MNMDDNIQLRLVGITYNQIESGVYALILEDPVELRRLAIVIGYPEAQSIECHLQKVRTPRPLSHDLMASMLHGLDAELLRVDIHRLPNGPYAGKLTLMSSDGEIITIDARSSDAIALAIRVEAPIYTNRELMQSKGYTPQKNNKSPKQSPNREAVAPTESVDNKWTGRSTQELHELLSKFVTEENYEAAAEIKLELDKRISSAENE